MRGQGQGGQVLTSSLYMFSAQGLHASAFPSLNVPAHITPQGKAPRKVFIKKKKKKPLAHKGLHSCLP